MNFEEFTVNCQFQRKMQNRCRYRVEEKRAPAPGWVSEEFSDLYRRLGKVGGSTKQAPIFQSPAHASRSLIFIKIFIMALCQVLSNVLPTNYRKNLAERCYFCGMLSEMAIVNPAPLSRLCPWLMKIDLS